MNLIQFIHTLSKYNIMAIAMYNIQNRISCHERFAEPQGNEAPNEVERQAEKLVEERIKLSFMSVVKIGFVKLAKV